jgi:nicotinate-nucleotide pyrophosphorylase (carboxylating)
MTPVPLARIMVEPLVRAALLEDLGRAGDLTTGAIVPDGVAPAATSTPKIGEN